MNFELSEAQDETVRQVRMRCTNFPNECWPEHLPAGAPHA
jgi:hypothetical protein